MQILKIDGSWNSVDSQKNCILKDSLNSKKLENFEIYITFQNSFYVPFGRINRISENS